MDISFKLTGLNEVLSDLKALESKVQKNVIRKGFRKGASIIRTAARANAPADGGRLKRAIKTFAGRGRTRDEIRISVGVKAKDATYGLQVETGTSDTPAQPFLRPAFDQNVEKVVEEIDRAIVEALNNL